MGSRPQFSEAQALAGAALKTFSQATHHSVSLDQMGRQTHGPGRQHDQLLHRDVGDYDPISLTAATMTTAGTEVPAGRACLQTEEALCCEIVPDINELPVKRPLRPSDLQLPDRKDILEELAEPSAKKPRETPGRNEPCWCGSGKKYKYCHLREDQRKRR